MNSVERGREDCSSVVSLKINITIFENILYNFTCLGKYLMYIYLGR